MKSDKDPKFMLAKSIGNYAIAFCFDRRGYHFKGQKQSFHLGTKSGMGLTLVIGPVYLKIWRCGWREASSPVVARRSIFFPGL
jgi:hypothetical protein